MTAYAQVVADPRPELAQLAKWQRISPSALRHRYNDHHVQAVRELLLPEPLIDIGLEPFAPVVDHDFARVSPALDYQLALRTRMRMRQAASDEFYATFGAEGSKKLGMSKNPADERVTRPIADIGGFMGLALSRRDPKLLPIYAEWTRRFNNRLITPDDVKQTGSRVRRGTK